MALFYISQSTDISEFIASPTVSSGDVLLLEDGVYAQSVLITKNYVRIVANGCNVIFNGFGILVNAFILADTTGVEITGVKIENYIGAGIAIVNGTANRIVENHISNTGVSGVLVQSSSANLILENEISAVTDGIRLWLGSTGNYVIRNHLHHCTDDGLDSFLSEDVNNVIIQNFSHDNQGNGFEIFGANNLAFNNKAKDNANSGFYIVAGQNSVALSNKSEYNAQNGLIMGLINGFAEGNTSRENTLSGVLVTNDYNILQENEIFYNQSNGIQLNQGADYNLIFKNRLKGNTPQNISNSGENNNFFRNVVIDSSCPC